MDSFSGKIYLLISFWLIRNVFAFNSNTMVRFFLASFGLTTAKQCPCRLSTFGDLRRTDANVPPLESSLPFFRLSRSRVTTRIVDSCDFFLTRNSWPTQSSWNVFGENSSGKLNPFCAASLKICRNHFVWLHNLAFWVVKAEFVLT